MNNEQDYLALEDCLEAIESGEDLEICLRRYPELAGELRPALEAAQMARLLSDNVVSPAALHRSRTRLLRIAANLRSRRPVRRWFVLRPNVIFSALLLAVLFFLSWRGLLTVSAKALPGDPLYRVKLVGENLSLQLTAGSETRRAMSARFERRRVDEVEKLLQLGRVVNVLFTGVVDEQLGGKWRVGGIDVIFDSSTEIKGEIAPGMVVQVAGQTQPGGWVVGSVINLYSYQFIGLVEDITKTEWDISGVKLLVNWNSQIDPAIRLGDMAIVLVQVNDDQSLKARAILRFLSHTAVPSTLNPDNEVNAPVLPPLATEVEFTGIVEEISENSWRINGHEVRISAATEINGVFILGDSVKVHALVGGDGTLTAREIEHIDDDATIQQPGEENKTSDGSADSSGDGSAADYSSQDGDTGNESPETGESGGGANEDSGDKGGEDGGGDSHGENGSGGKDDEGGGQGGAGEDGGSGEEGEEHPPEEEGGEGKEGDGGSNEDGGEDKPEK